LIRAESRAFAHAFTQSEKPDQASGHESNEQHKTQRRYDRHHFGSSVARSPACALTEQHRFRRIDGLDGEKKRPMSDESPVALAYTMKRPFQDARQGIEKKDRSFATATATPLSEMKLRRTAEIREHD
jgi:hypothetical protein